MTDDFFGDLGKSISKYAQNAADKTSTFLETTKTTAQISAENREIEKLYQKIGQLVYERAVKDAGYAEPEINGYVEEIQHHNEQITALKTALADLKGMKVCPSCHDLIPKEVAFCPKCGAATKSETENTSEEKTTVVEEAQKEAEAPAENAAAEEPTAAPEPEKAAEPEDAVEAEAEAATEEPPANE